MARIDGRDLHWANLSDSWFISISLGREMALDDEGDEVFEELGDGPGRGEELEVE